MLNQPDVLWIALAPMKPSHWGKIMTQNTIPTNGILLTIHWSCSDSVADSCTHLILFFVCISYTLIFKCRFTWPFSVISFSHGNAWPRNLVLEPCGQSIEFSMDWRTIVPMNPLGCWYMVFFCNSNYLGSHLPFLLTTKKGVKYLLPGVKPVNLVYQ